MSEKNGKMIDFENTGQAQAAIESLPRRIEYISGQRFSYVKLDDVVAIMESARSESNVRVGDRFRFTAPAMKFIVNEPDSSTVVVRLDEIVVEADGCKKLIVVPE